MGPEPDMLLRLLFPEASVLLPEGACPNASLHILPTPNLLGTGNPTQARIAAPPTPRPPLLTCPPLLTFTRPRSPSPALAHLCPPPQRAHHRPCARGGRRAQRPLHHGALPARQGHRPEWVAVLRVGRACGAQLGRSALPWNEQTSLCCIHTADQFLICSLSHTTTCPPPLPPPHSPPRSG